MCALNTSPAKLREIYSQALPPRFISNREIEQGQLHWRARAIDGSASIWESSHQLPHLHPTNK